MFPNRRQPTSRRATAALAVLLAALVTIQLVAQTVTLTPNQHKALFLYNFAKYTEWPKEVFADESAPFVFGILGKEKDPVGKELEGIIKGKNIKGRALEVKYYSPNEQIAGCQLLFITSGEAGKLAQILKTLAKSSILTIAETDGFLEASGMINLVTERKSTGTQTVSFEINLVAANRANLKLDVQLLKLARNVLRT